MHHHMQVIICILVEIFRPTNIFHINLWPCYLFCLCPIYPSFPFHHYLNIYRHTDCLSLKFCLFYSFSIYVLTALYLQHRLCHFMYSTGLCLSTTALSFIYYCCHGSYAYKIVTVWYKSQVKQLLSEEIKVINASLYSYATPLLGEAPCGIIFLPHKEPSLFPVGQFPTYENVRCL